MGYEKTIKLEHDEVAAKINLASGEIITLEDKVKKFKQGYERVNGNTVKWSRSYNKAWALLAELTNDREFKVAHKLATRANYRDNSLCPLDDDMSCTELGEELGVNRKEVDKIINKLFRLGVIGKWEVYQAHEVHKKYWVFNPYLSFNGNCEETGMRSLFKDTYFA